MPPTNSYKTVQSHNHSYNSPAQSPQRIISVASTLEAANRDRTSVTVRPTEEKSLCLSDPTQPMDGPNPCPYLAQKHRKYIHKRHSEVEMHLS